MMRRPRLTARARLTTFYGTLFLSSGAALVALIVVMMFPPLELPTIPNEKKAVVVTSKQVNVEINDVMSIKQRTRDELRMKLITASGLALGVMTAVALGLGWAMAGRVLRPVRSVSSAARRLSEQDLHQRIPVSGPDDELKELAETFNGMIARLERAFVTQRLFTANASHELRGPMTTQRALVDVTLATPGVSQDAAELATDLREVLRRQERLVNGLFELASSQHGVQRRDPIQLDRVVREVLLRWRPAAGAAGLDVVEDLPPAVINGDPVLVEILVDNLVRNAIMHNQRGGWLRVRTDVGVLSVENTGAELSPQRLAELTEPFRQGTRDRAGHTEGAGLGLAIVDTVAKAHNGSLRLLARHGGGVAATVSFPLNFC